MMALIATAWIAFGAGFAVGAAWCASSVVRKMRR